MYDLVNLRPWKTKFTRVKKPCRISTHTTQCD